MLTLGLGFRAMDSLYKRERAILNVWKELVPIGDNWSDAFIASAAITNFDAVRGELTLRISYIFVGDNLMAKDGYSLKTDAWMICNSVRGDNFRRFKKGSNIPPRGCHFEHRSLLRLPLR